MNLLVNIDVNDLDEAVRFYCSTFGLTVGRRFGDAGRELLGAAAPIYLLAKPDATPIAEGVDARRTYQRHWTPVHLDFVVDDIESVAERAMAAGARLEAPVSARRWGKLALLADPFGHGFCLVEFTGRGYDEIADRDG
jgi:predicted enzyme related to lactoylglutathione lyase